VRPNRGAEPECVRSEPGGGAVVPVVRTEGEALPRFTNDWYASGDSAKPDGGERLLGNPDRFAAALLQPSTAVPFWNRSRTVDFHRRAMGYRAAAAPHQAISKLQLFIRR